ncbi:amino acid racemase [Hymenobacter sp. BT175]|uniref:aspartate/glutamate racemase family protein n=1 Tax=Hymenobacter translucens TaxID=2886507 RepID=UPI001D0E3EA1|nr:amino acid racemase [Hymenobacter translucens]MCC2547669.1 amino acid racemase [Hymenobacter translucens]
MKKLGLVGGISWVSTIDYYTFINEGINERLGGLNFAECIIYSLNFGDVQAAHWDNSFDLLHNACRALKSSGAEGILLCANTAHIFSKQLAEQTGLPIIDIVSATAKAVSSQGIGRVGLLGTKFTMEMDFFKSGLDQQGIEVLIPASAETRDYIQRTLKEELGRGVLNPETRTAYISIIAELIEQGAGAIILACTEIPLLIKPEDIDVPVFDTTKIHSQAAVDFALAH